MRIELLFHMVFLIFCFEVQFDQNCRKKSDRFIIATRSLQYNVREVLGKLESENIDAYGLVESEGSDWAHSQIRSCFSEFKLEPEEPEEEAHEALETDQVPGPGK